MRRTRAVLGVILLSASFVTCAGNLSDEPSWLRIKPLLFGAGGCSAPVNKGAHLRDLGRMKLRVEDQFAEPGEPVLAQLNVMHPQFSGMASNVTMEPHFVRQVDVYYGEERIMRAQVDFTISENPMFRFYFQPQGEADLRAEDRGQHGSARRAGPAATARDTERALGSPGSAPHHVAARFGRTREQIDQGHGALVDGHARLGLFVPFVCRRFLRLGFLGLGVETGAQLCQRRRDVSGKERTGHRAAVPHELEQRDGDVTEHAEAAYLAFESDEHVESLLHLRVHRFERKRAARFAACWRDA